MKTTKVIAVTSLTGGIVLLGSAAREGMRYSSLGDPGAVNIALRLFLAGALLIAVTFGIFVTWIVRNASRQARALGLTHDEAAAAGFIALELAQYELGRHNERVSARLTDSVMGPVRGGPWN